MMKTIQIAINQKIKQQAVEATQMNKYDDDDFQNLSKMIIHNKILNTF